MRTVRASRTPAEERMEAVQRPAAEKLPGGSNKYSVPQVLGLQRSMGNKATGQLLASRRNPASIPAPGSLRPIGRQVASTIQRAGFADLMAFWKEKELGVKEPPAPVQSAKPAANLPPAITNNVPEEVAAMNPMLEAPPEKQEDQAGPLGGGSAGHYNVPLGGGSAGHYGVLLNNSFQQSSSGGASPLLLSESASATASPTSASATGSLGGPAPVLPDTKGSKSKVKYIQTDEARKEFELEIGGSLKQGGEAYDTSKMYSKFMGDGFGIFVMSADGRFYSTSHKIGLFHHSSFLAGGAVAGAGEMKVEGGTLKYITNKSGHYWPGDRELVQTLTALKRAGVGISSVVLGQLLPSGGMNNPYPGGAEQFLTDKGGGGPGASNKDAIKYETKPMVGNVGEDTNSVDTVRIILRSFVDAAQKGKLRKFNKPNPAFGNTYDDIKALALAEFGWSEGEVDQYKAILENWNNDREIQDVGVVPTLSLSQSYSTNYSGSVGSGSFVSGSHGGGSLVVDPDAGRDFEAELEELLKTQPEPDWVAMGCSPYGSGFSIPTNTGSYFQLSDKHKVQLMKGEKTFAEFQAG